MKRPLVILALLLAKPAVAQTVIYQHQLDGTSLVTPLDGRPSWITVRSPGTSGAYPTYGPTVKQPYAPLSPYPPES